MKRFILLTITLMMMISLFGQSDIDDLIFGPEKQDQAPAKDPKLAKPDDDFIKVNFAKKTRDWLCCFRSVVGQDSIMPINQL